MPKNGGRREPRQLGCIVAGLTPFSKPTRTANYPRCGIRFFESADELADTGHRIRIDA